VAAPLLGSSRHDSRRAARNRGGLFGSMPLQTISRILWVSIQIKKSRRLK
jgi:hypothetical protein